MPISAVAVDEDAFIRDFHRRVEGTMASEESKRAAKRLAALRQTIKQERRELLNLFTAMSTAPESDVTTLITRLLHSYQTPVCLH